LSAGGGVEGDGDMKTKIITLAIVTCCWACLNQAQAVPITIEIGGEITGGYGTLWGGDIHVGSSITGTYTYDSATPNTSTLGEMGKYVFDSPYGMDLFLGGFEFKTVPSHTGQFQITIFDNGANADSYEVRSNQNVPLSNGATVDYVFWGLHGSNSMLSSTDLPVVAPVVIQWPDKYLYLHGADTLGNGFLFWGKITQAVLVPEPLTGVLLMTGVFFLRRRR
jgi:hypothetical protein